MPEEIGCSRVVHSGEKRKNGADLNQNTLASASLSLIKPLPPAEYATSQLLVDIQSKLPP